ncbi:MAG: hypothetical protein ABIT82_09090 [Ramlibacter sp.]
MALMGKAAVAMWWHIAPEHREEFLDWHTHEHQPERLGIEGFHRGTRWTSSTDATGFFVTYELAERATLTAAAYMERLNHPSPWSVNMMPHHARMVRTLADVSFSAGAGTARCAITLQLSPQPEKADALRTHLHSVLTGLAQLRGISGAHLLEASPVVQAEMTAEQRIRGGDAMADWVVLVVGYDAKALVALTQNQLAAEGLATQGAKPSQTAGWFELSGTLNAAERAADAKP